MGNRAIISLSGVTLYVLVAAMCTGAFAWLWPWENEPVLEVHPPPIEGIIWYRPSRPDNMRYWFDAINRFLDDYVNPRYEENIDERCSLYADHTASPGEYCQFKIEWLDNCSPGKTEGQYGFPQRKPCIFLTLNKIENWMPQAFNEQFENQIINQEHRAMYRRMPESLKEAITMSSDRNMIWVSCEGENGFDRENAGPIHFSPLRGFPLHYFPYRSINGYQSPIVAIQFERPKSGILINIICKAWAKNIKHEENEEVGRARFQLMVD